jgi:phosphatidate cytidylyltransferase
MLTRIISGLLLGFLFLLLAMQSTPWVLVAFGVPHVIAQFEFTSLAPRLGIGLRVLWTAATTAIWHAAWSAMSQDWHVALVLALASAIALAISIARIARYERSADSHATPSIPILAAMSVFAIAVPFAMMAAIATFSQVLPYLLLLIGAGWAADSAGVFTGKFFGLRALAPRLSPKKTREGAIGGLLAAGLVGVATLAISRSQLLLADAGWLQGWTGYAVAFGTGALAAAAGICGDLTFSMHKRLAGLKDYGTIIPGHGGVLDRFDAMLFATPVIYLALLTG